MESSLDKIKNTASDFGDNISEKFNNVGDNINSGLSNIKNNMDETVAEFSSNSTVKAASNFLDMNTNIAKFAFIILVVVAFIVLFNLGIRFIGYFFTSGASNPYLINGQIQANNPGTKFKQIYQDPKVPDSITIPRSNNALTGIEFTWTVWILYNAVPPDITNYTYMNVFTKGDFNGVNISRDLKSSFPSLNNGPGVYLGPPSNSKKDGDSNSPPITNSLWILMDTMNAPAGKTVVMSEPVSTEYIEIPNVPIGKYFHLAIRCENKFLDVYINGTVVSHMNLQYVPKQNYYDVHVGDPKLNGSLLSDLRYFSTALSVIDINNIVTRGPNTNNASNSTMLPGYNPNYLSSMWYTNLINHTT